MKLHLREMELQISIIIAVETPHALIQANHQNWFLLNV